MRNVERNVLDVIARHGIVDGETLDRHFYDQNSETRNYRLRQLAAENYVKDYKLDPKRKYWVLGSAGERLCGTKRRGNKRDFAGDELRRRYGTVRFCFDREDPLVLMRSEEFTTEFPELVLGIERIRSNYFFDVGDNQPRRLGHILVDTVTPEDQLLKRAEEAVEKRVVNERMRELIRANAFYCVIVTGDVKKSELLVAAAKDRQAKGELSVAVDTFVVSDLFDVA